MGNICGEHHLKLYLMGAIYNGELFPIVYNVVDKFVGIYDGEIPYIQWAKSHMLMYFPESIRFCDVVPK